MSADCHFCGQIAALPDLNLLKPLLGSEWSERPVLAERPAAVVMPSIGALTAGHVLVCPVEHARSIAAASDEAVADVELLSAEAKDLLSNSLDLPVHAFEHGSGADTGRVACSIEHAHLHLIPAAAEIRPRLLELASWEPIADDVDALRRRSEGREYLVYEAPAGGRWIATTESGFPSQLLRRVFADALGCEDEWNWRDHAACAKVEATVSLFPARPMPAYA